MTREEAIKEIENIKKFNYTLAPLEVFDMAIKALELLDTLTERPCDVCEHHKEKGCCKWNCVFDGYIGGKK